MGKLLKYCLFILFTAVVISFFNAQTAFSLAHSLKFAQVSDIHYSLVKEDTSYKLLSKTKPLLLDAIANINNTPALDFVMITGDGINRPEENTLNALADDLNTLKYPWYYVLGNHDTTTTGYLNKTNFIEILKEKNPKYSFNSTYYSFRPKKGFKVIVLDGAKNEGVSSNGIIPAEELNWLDSQLEETKKNEIVLIFIHFPLLPPYDSKSHEIINVKEVKEVLYKYDMPIAIFSGHYHMTKITKRGNILHVSTPSLAGYPHAFRIVEVINNSKEAVFKIEFIETGLKDLQAKTKLSTLRSGLYYGNEQDRTAVITIKKKK